MDPDIDRLLHDSGGAAARARLLAGGVPRARLDHELRTAQLLRPFPRAYLRPWEVDQVASLERAAYLSVGAPTALSHLTALRRWGLAEAPEDVHLVIPVRRRARPRPGLVVHRVRGVPPTLQRDGLAVVTPAEALVTSWPLLAPRDRRGPAIAAVRDHLVGPAQLRRGLQRHPKLRGRSELATLIGLLAAGCESELEIWGLLHVFDIPGLRHARRQLSVHVRGRRYRLDQAYEQEKVDVELDGDAYHSSRQQRERDRRRDAALASTGWLTLRFSYGRLHEDVAGCRRETLGTLAARQHR